MLLSLQNLVNLQGSNTASFSSATTDGADVLAAQVGLVVGFSVAVTEGADTLAANVSVIVAASSATTDGADVLAAVVPPIVGITSATTDGADVLSAVVPPVVGITAATTDGADVLAANVSIVASGADFSSATTDGADTLAAAIATEIAASSATTDGADVASAAVDPTVDAASATTDGADVLLANVDPLGSVDFSALLLEDADALAASVDSGSASDFIVTPGAPWVQPAKGETAEQKRKRRIRQGIIREEVPEVPKIEIIKPDPLAVRYAEVLQATIAEAQASGAKAREYIARLNAQIDAQEFAKQQEAARIASEIEAKARQDLEDFDITYIAALMAVF
jgi:hypothetical protein